MNLLRAILESWRRRTGGVRRVVVVVLEGADTVQVDHFLEQGLLHYLALLNDIGTQFESRFKSRGTAAIDCDELCKALLAQRIRAARIPSATLSPHSDLDAICAADHMQQELMILALKRGRNRVVVCKFDMLRQLARLFGLQPNTDQQLVIRDVYARMDEVVGKALSCCDPETTLLVVIPPNSGSPDSESRPKNGMIFSSHRCDPPPPDDFQLAEFVRQLLSVGRSGA